MLKLVNPENDPKAAQLVEEAVASISSHWQDLLGEIEVVVFDKPFNEVLPDEQIAGVEKKRVGEVDWESVEVLRNIQLDSGEQSISVRYNDDPIMGNPDYYFKLDFFVSLGTILWFRSAVLREQITQELAGTSVAQSRGASFLVFRDSFARFFLNPKYLQEERRASSWSFMCDLDDFVLAHANSNS